MGTQYDDWIREHITDPHGKCVEATLEMAAAFPELKRVRGHYHSAFQGTRPHWWLVTLNGQIVDPTASQFSAVGMYEEWDETQPEPTGKCPNCGELIYDGGFVHTECEASYARYCMGF